VGGQEYFREEWSGARDDRTVGNEKRNKDRFLGQPTGAGKEGP
jgi:hypothetical protein